MLDMLMAITAMQGQLARAKLARQEAARFSIYASWLSPKQRAKVLSIRRDRIERERREAIAERHHQELVRAIRTSRPMGLFG